MDLSGNIYVTTDENVVFEIINTRPDIKLINLDETNELRIDPKYFIPGSILLPPIEAIVAEVDGNEQKYDMIYSDHIRSSVVEEYIAYILAYLYRGGSILMYYPDAEYNNTLKKMLYFIYITYGIHIGIMNDPDPNNQVCYLDNRYENLCLDLILLYTKILDWREYLYQFPSNRTISKQVLQLLIDMVAPFGSYEEKIETINDLKKQIKENPRVIVPLQSY